MKKISIKIPGHLSAKDEVKFIAEKLMQKALSGHGNQEDKKRLGTQVDIEHLTTQITIERTGEKPIEMVLCNVCGCDYQNDLCFPVYVNYGGKSKMLKYCSQKCADLVVSICGEGRASNKKKHLKPVRLW